MFLLWLRQLPWCALLQFPHLLRADVVLEILLFFPPSSFIQPSFAWYLIFFSLVRDSCLLSAAAACSSVSEGVFLMYPRRETSSTSTCSSAILFSLSNGCLWTVMLEKTLESPSDWKEIQPVHHKGNQCWVFIGRTDVEAEAPILWPSDAKDPEAGKDWGQEKKGMTEDEMVGWHHRLHGSEFE